MWACILTAFKGIISYFEAVCYAKMRNMTQIKIKIALPASDKSSIRKKTVTDHRNNLPPIKTKLFSQYKIHHEYMKTTFLLVLKCTHCFLFLYVALHFPALSNFEITQNTGYAI